jgi:hypothetical protein
MTEQIRPITTEESTQIAKTLYEPTIHRMRILCNSLIQTTANGDFALWAPMAVMEGMLIDLKWSVAIAPERFLALISLTLRRYAEKCEVHQMAVMASKQAGAPMPAFQVWTNEDTIAVYDEIDAKYPKPDAADLPPAIEPPPGGPEDPGGTANG